MKFLVVLSCVVIAAAIVRAEDDTEKFMGVLKKELNECLEESKMDTDLGKLVKRLQALDSSPEDARELGCLRACVMKKSGYMTGADNKVDGQKIKDVIQTMQGEHPEKIASRGKIVDDCIEEVKGKTDECDIAGEFGKCYMTKLANL